MAPNKDPMLERMLMALVGKLPTELHDKFENRFEMLEDDKRERSVVISGVSEAGPDTILSIPVRKVAIIFCISFSLIVMKSFVT
ncbi:hypothetical protein OESDEN_01461 [Oesophagostomum dentatum]|uniref:Uncharacterized protein n=1 Tax=Oesophagostomum dentatum TaxID=61180 RepID=A0A0B1TLX6_OESDE|nr:hypothetical protein OESDEN_01461 [Oesophagostomum dentatum]